MPDPSAVFAALADPTRRAVMRSVADKGPITATEIAERLPISRQAVAKHLDTLEGAGLVDRERQGRELLYRLTPAPLEDAVAWMDDVGSRWDRRIANLQRHLKGSRRP